MDQAIPNAQGEAARSERLLPFVLLLFVGSGCAALIYEIVWLQMLQLVIGLTTISLGVLLGTFMGGMCLGSLLLSRLISARHHPLRVYAMLELGIGIMGIVVLFGMPFIDRVYTLGGGRGFAGIMFRAAVAGVCLVPPTLLMGATLPAISRWVETTPHGVSWLGFFYGGNIAGAVFGCLLAGFYLLRVHDAVTATYVAAAINGAVALVAFILAAQGRPTAHGLSCSQHVANNPKLESQADDSGFTNAAASKDVRAPGLLPIYVTIALSGLAALGAEVVCTRLLAMTLGGTV